MSAIITIAYEHVYCVYQIHHLPINIQYNRGVNQYVLLLLLLIIIFIYVILHV
jgi:hypothetical protein